MLVEQKKQYRASSNAMAATIDAKRRSATAQQRYTIAQQSYASALHLQMVNAWIRSKVYLTYRGDFVTIKVNNPSAADKLSKEVAAAEVHAQVLGAEKVVTAQGIIYRFKP